METNDSAEPKRLTGRRGEFEFEMWVEIGGRPLEIYALTQGADGASEAWIASEIGKCYEVRAIVTSVIPRAIWHEKYEDLRVTCKVDNVNIKGISMSAHDLRSTGSSVRIRDQRITRNLVQKLQFAEPVLTERTTPGVMVYKLATIELKVRTMSEANHEGQACLPRHQRCLQKIGFRVDQKIQPGEPGLEEDHPIVVEDAPPQAGSSTEREVREKIDRLVSVKKEADPDAGDAVSQIADEIAAARKILEELEERRRAAEALQCVRQASGVDEVDNKEDVLERASKRLEIAKKEDGGFVDLTVDGD